MRALRFDRFGDLHVLHVAEIADPDAPPPMTNTAFDDGVERSYKVLLDKTSRFPVARERPAHPIPAADCS
jgi:hypothetical protein